jgi:hypothetical protein
MLRLLDSLGQHRRSGRKWSAQNDQRTTYRYPAVENECRLAWWAGDDFHELPARVENFSLRGALVVSSEMPATTEVYLRLLHPIETDWTLLTIVRAENTRKGKHRIGAEFRESCPYELFTVLPGYQLEYKNRSASPEFNSRDWR